MSDKKIVLVGGGSYGWIPTIVKDMILTESIADSRFVLYDIDKKAAELVAAFLEKLNGSLKTGATFVPTDDSRMMLLVVEAASTKLKVPSRISVGMISGSQMR